jgi:hypothetical protein
MKRAEKILNDVILLSEVEALDIQIWRVPVAEEYPEGIRYSYNYRLYVAGRWIDVVRWDNYHGEGPHRDERDPNTGKMKKVSDVFRTPDEVVEIVYEIRNEMKARWIG